jgi:type IV pilus secretin PilQ/predicted competence protein
MHSNLKTFVFISLLSLAQLCATHAATDELPFRDPGIPISMDFQDANLKDLLKIFSIQSGLNFIASEAVQDRKITLYLDKVPIREAMDKLFSANNLYYELDKNSNIFIVKDYGKPSVNTITRVYKLKYLSVPSSAIERDKAALFSETGSASTGAGGGDIVSLIRQMLTENGKIAEHARSNSLIITDVPNNFSVIEQVIVALDVPQPMVMLEVEMLDVSKNAIDKLGVNWPQTLASLTVPGSREVQFPFGGHQTDLKTRTIDPTAGIFGGAGAGWDFAAWPATSFGPAMLTVIGSTLSLDMFKSLSDAKTLARPKILTLNNETAEIKITTNESLNPLSTSNTDTGTNTISVDRTETGVSLRVTPQINPNGDITLTILPKVSDTKNGITVGTGATAVTVKDPEERSTHSIVRVRDSETVILGGLIRNDYSETETKVPFFGNMPVIGAFFRHKSVDSNRDRELIVFITPRIIKDRSIDLAQLKKTSVPEREQGLFTGIDRNAIIESSLNVFERK